MFNSNVPLFVNIQSSGGERFSQNTVQSCEKLSATLLLPQADRAVHKETLKHISDFTGII